jgi:hypothetical protein
MLFLPPQVKTFATQAVKTTGDVVSGKLAGKVAGHIAEKSVDHGWKTAGILSGGSLIADSFSPNFTAQTAIPAVRNFADYASTSITKFISPLSESGLFVRQHLESAFNWVGKSFGADSGIGHTVDKGANLIGTAGTYLHTHVPQLYDAASVAIHNTPWVQSALDTVTHAFTSAG